MRLPRRVHHSGASNRQLVTPEIPSLSQKRLHSCDVRSPSAHRLRPRQRHGRATDLERAARARRPVQARHPRAARLSSNPSVDHVDFEEHAVLVADALAGGGHLVGRSTGGVISLLAAAAEPERVRSLTVIEPPCTKVAAGDPDADTFTREGIEWWRDGPTDDPEAFLRGFLEYVGSDYVPPTTAAEQLLQGARTLIVERGPWEAEIPLDALAASPFPKLVVSGAHHAGFDAVCNVLEERLPAERLVFPGYGHASAAASRLQRWHTGGNPFVKPDTRAGEAEA